MLLSWLALCLAWVQAPALEAPLVPQPERLQWRTLAGEAARAGEAELVGELTLLLERLGDDPAELARQREAWERTLAGSKLRRDARTSLARRIQRELPGLVAELAHLEGDRRLALARCIVALDHTEPTASALLGRARTADGEWLTDEERRWKEGALRIARLEREARAMQFQLEEGASENPVLTALGGGRFASSYGLELHSNLPAESLERILESYLRASVFAAALVKGDLTRPSLRERTFLLLSSAGDFRAALDEAVANQGLAASLAEEVRRYDFRSFTDSRGWTTLHGRPQADFAAYLLWEASPAWLAGEPQPCLSTGHLNAVALRMLGTTLPLIAWREEGAGQGGGERSRPATQALVRDARWRTARRDLLGCKSWLVRAVRAGEDPPWSRAMLDQEGRITDENLYKTTFVCEYLHVEGRLGELLESSRGRRHGPSVIEKALGETLTDFETRWRRWLDPPREASVMARLAREPDERAPSEFAAAMLALNQARANAHKGQALEIPLVALEEELGRGAEAHAHYLVQNPAQRELWPDAHEQYADRPGFSPEGALSAARSLLAFGESPEEAIESWLGTFYHRLPLLDPGLLGVGFGRQKDVFVADVRSLVAPVTRDHVALWPMPDAVDVPRAFRTEFPNPVPGSDMNQLGFPVTVQLFFLEAREDVTLELELLQGEKRVEGHSITPDRPLFRELAPPNAWCFIPARRLAARTTYTAVARWLGQTRRWEFTTGP